MAEFALINQNLTIVRFDTSVNASKFGAQPTWPKWVPVEIVGDVATNETQVKEGPVQTVESTRVVRTFTVRSKTAPELAADKVARIDAMNGQQAMLKIVLNLENDNRAIKKKINDLITDIAASTAKFPVGQATQIDMAQLKTALAALL